MWLIAGELPTVVRNALRERGLPARATESGKMIVRAPTVAKEQP